MFKLFQDFWRNPRYYYNRGLMWLNGLTVYVFLLRKLHVQTGPFGFTELMPIRARPSKYIRVDKEGVKHVRRQIHAYPVLFYSTADVRFITVEWWFLKPLVFLRYPYENLGRLQGLAIHAKACFLGSPEQLEALQAKLNLKSVESPATE